MHKIHIHNALHTHTRTNLLIRQLATEPIQCPDLSIRNGTVTISPSDRSSGAMATYTCNDGFILVGVDTRVCQSNATWSLPTPECGESLFNLYHMMQHET